MKSRYVIYSFDEGKPFTMNFPSQVSEQLQSVLLKIKKKRRWKAHHFNLHKLSAINTIETPIVNFVEYDKF